MKRFLFQKVLPYFVWQNEETGKYEIVNNWRENVVEVYARDIEHAKEVALLTGIIENVHYNDVLEFIGTA